MDIQARKLEFVQAFLKIQNEELILFFESMIKSEKERMSLDELNQRINQSEKDFENGDYLSHEEVFAKYLIPI